MPSNLSPNEITLHHPTAENALLIFGKMKGTAFTSSLFLYSAFPSRSVHEVMIWPRTLPHLFKIAWRFEFYTYIFTLSKTSEMVSCISVVKVYYGFVCSFHFIVLATSIAAVEVLLLKLTCSYFLLFEWMQGGIVLLRFFSVSSREI